MKTFVLILTLLASSVLAQDITRGDGLRTRQFRTFAAVTYFVDPTGSDTNACTASGTSACATVAGVLTKFPKFIQDNITINVAAGTYPGFTMTNLVFSGNGIVRVNIAGVMGTFSPATGTATGTLTAASTGNATVDVLTDSTQAWTADNLRGRFFKITSGTGLNESRVVISNTATTVTVVRYGGTAPVAGSGYTIETPASVFNSTVTINGNVFGGSNNVIDLGRVDIASSSGSALSLTCASSGGGIRLGETRITTTSVGSTGFVNSGCTVSSNALGTLFGVYIQATSGLAVSVLSTSPTIFGLNQGSNGWVAVASGATSSVVQLRNVQTAAWQSFYVVATGAGGSVPALSFIDFIQGQTPTSFQSPRTYVSCTNPQPGITLLNSSLPELSDTAVEVVGCDTALSVGRGSLFQGTTFYCTTATTCVEVSNGGRYEPEGNSIISGVTNDYIIDGVTYPQTTIQSFSPRRVIGPNGSAVQLP